MNAPDYRRLTTRLIEYSFRLEDLTTRVRTLDSQPLTPELLDELAVTVDELLLTLDEHRHACGPDLFIETVISKARALTRGVRAQALEREQIAEAVCGVTDSLARMIRQDKRAA